MADFGVTYLSFLSSPCSSFVFYSSPCRRYEPGLPLTNGILVTFVNNVNNSQRSLSFITQLWESGQLLNPVVGMRFNPLNPKLTVGALDPADYQGEINWVQLETPNVSWDLLNVSKIDGFKGYNGSFFPSGSNDNLAGIDSRESIPLQLSFPLEFTDVPLFTSTHGNRHSQYLVIHQCERLPRASRCILRPPYLRVPVQYIHSICGTCHSYQWCGLSIPKTIFSSFADRMVIVTWDYRTT